MPLSQLRVEGFNDPRRLATLPPDRWPAAAELIRLTLPARLGQKSRYEPLGPFALALGAFHLFPSVL